MQTSEYYDAAMLIILKILNKELSQQENMLQTTILKTFVACIIEKATPTIAVS